MAEETRFWVKLNPPTYYSLRAVADRQEQFLAYRDGMLEAQRNAIQTAALRYSSSAPPWIEPSPARFGPVHVDSYTRRDRTFVNSHYRSRARR